MTDLPPVLLTSPVYDPKVTWVPGSSIAFDCAICHRTLVVSPSSLRHMRAVPAEVLHICSWCTDQLAAAWAEGDPEGTEALQVSMVPGADAELRAAGLDQLADADQRELERIRALFGRS